LALTGGGQRETLGYFNSRTPRQKKKRLQEKKFRELNKKSQKKIEPTPKALMS